MIDQMIKTLDGLLETNATRIAQVNSSNLGNATPCKDYDVRGVVNHIVGGMFMFKTIVEGGQMPGGDAPDFTGDPSGNYLTAKTGLLASLNDPANLERTWAFPFGSMDAVRGLGVMLLEAAVHGWDLAKGLGVDATIDPQIAGMILAGAQQAISPDWRNESGNPFAPEVKVADDASPTDKLVAFLGRKP